MTTKSPPRKLYKYRSFCSKSLRLLCEAEIYYADPRSFNDPLDCDPTIQVDTDRASLEKLCGRMLLAAADGKKEKAMGRIGDLRHRSTECGNYRTDPRAEKYYIQLLASEIKKLLDAEMASWGVSSLAERWDCPIMWSHYAEEHRGLCIEYDTAGHLCRDLKPVGYKRPRSIRTAELMRWKLHESDEARRNILDAYFFAKSPSWRYEKEWRDIQPKHGEHPLPFRITGVYFGLRCDPSVQTSVVKLFANSGLPIKFYDIYPLAACRT